MRLRWHIQHVHKEKAPSKQSTDIFHNMIQYQFWFPSSVNSDQQCYHCVKDL